MWAVFIIILFPSGPREVWLEEYRTEHQCGIEKIRIELEMHKSYPKDHDYRLVCRKKVERA